MDINLTTPVNPLGYGTVGTNILKSLVSSGHNVSLFPLGQVSANKEDESLLQSCIKNQSFFNHRAPSIRIWHQHDLAQHIGSGLRCGFPIFELDRLTDRESHHILSQDVVFVCSHWAKTVVEQYNKKSVVVPLGVDSEVFCPSDTPSWETTRFINIGKWELRKGHDVLVDAFNKAFNVDDDVQLLMMNHNPFISEEEEKEWIGLYKDSKLGNKIFFLERVESHRQVADIMKQVDCGVFLSRAEGWNLEALELMACGKQVIITNCTAHTEFCNIKNSLLVTPEAEEEAFDGIWFKGQGRWAAIGEREIDECVEHMREVHKKKQAGTSLLNKYGVETAERFSWENTVKKMTEAIELVGM
tara:strand:+ start:1696 stop:2766 length:1071 start_codon:yes stop_codon:yes gene_type:complete